jgi:hypothetical protein
MKLNRKNLKSLILEVLEESEYYNKHKDMDTDYATQAMELGQSMGDEGARDRTEQVEKYVRLKVDKEIKKDMLKQTRQSIQELVDETRGILGLHYLPGEEDDYDREQIEGFTKMYSKKLAPAMELAQSFDGTQESLDQWVFKLMTIEKELYKSKDPAMYYLGSIIPGGLHIGDPFFQSYQWAEDPDFGGVSRKYVDIENAVKDAEDFYRPGITKMVLKAQSAESGMDLGGMFGLNEDKGKKQ